MILANFLIKKIKASNINNIEMIDDIISAINAKKLIIDTL